MIWNDFGIDGAEGFELLVEYNATADPPWELDGKQGLNRLWERSIAKGPGPEGRGYRLLENRPGWVNGQPPTGDTAKPGSDDFAELDDVEPDDATERSSGLPAIVHNNRQYRDVEADAARALIAANNPPRVFVGNGCGLIDLQRRDVAGPLAARELNAASLRSVFARVADWLKVKDSGEVVDHYPPPELLSSFGAIGEWPGIPRLTSIVTYPVYGPGWALNATQGYHPASGIFCDLGDLALPAVQERPSADDVTAAKELIVTELFGDFPFVDQASRANAVAMLILPVIRHAIDGPTPLAMIDAPSEGTGKSLLAEVATLVTVGNVPEAIIPEAEILAAKQQRKSQPTPPGGVGLVPIYGTITQRADLFTEWSGGTATEKVGQQIDALAADPNVKAIVLDVDSPGGSVYGVAELADKIRAVAKDKKVIGVANSEAASAAYWLISQATEVVVTPSGQVGSIGVYVAHVDQSEALKLMGKAVTLVSAGERKVAGNSYEPLNQLGREELQKSVDDYYGMFTAAVAKGRGRAQSTVQKGFGKGGMVRAEDAVAEGMADKVGTLESVLSRYGLSVADVAPAAEADRTAIEVRKRRMRLN